MRRKQRLLLVSHLARSGDITGAERSLLNLAAGFRERGRDVVWLSPAEGASVDEARRQGFPVRVARFPRLFAASYQASAAASLLRALRFGAQAPRLVGLRRLLAAEQPDLVLVNTLVNLGALWAARSARLATLWRCAEILAPGLRQRRFRGAAEQLPDALVTVSAAVALALGARNAQVIPTGVSRPSAAEIAEARRELRERLGLPKDALVVGHVGQIRPHKGQLECVRGFALAGERAAGAVLAILGALDADPGYVRVLRDAGRPLGARLHMPGFVAGRGRAAAALDVLVFTSTAPDPFPLVVLEALAAGVPTLAFELGGVPEAIEHGRSGLLVPPGDVGALAEALAALLTSPELRHRLGREASERARLWFGLERSVDRYLQAIDEVEPDGR